ncbi:MAG: ABC transporter permease [Chitinophagia bacterium]|nr:ABC transporter permease [Chitinophagia bacterium]
MDQQLDIVSFKELLPSLNDIFIKLVEGTPVSRSFETKKDQLEYLTRVQKKTFIVSTLLLPVLYVGLIFGMGFIAEKSRETLSIAVIDSSGYFSAPILEKQNQFDSSSTLTLVNDRSEAQLKEKEDGYDGYLIIPALDWTKGLDSLPLNTYKSYGSATTAAVEAKINRIWSEVLNDSLQIDIGKQMILSQSRIGIKAKNIIDEKSDSDTAEGIGYVAGLLMYFILLVYGSQVMMGVMEEKTNRIAEVIVSSVRPFQMMLGKIIGIGAVALTQFLLWIVFILAAYNIAKEAGTQMGAAEMVGNMQRLFTNVDVPLILFCFGFYFLAGFFFYASLYGAVGSAVNEDIREAQSLSFPITMLVIISIAMMTASIANPSSSIAVWGSLIPFSSPIVMMARIPYGVPGTVPWWQLIASMIILVLSFLAMVWVAGKIYRTGILLYGKKVTWAEMLKWIFRKN